MPTYNLLECSYNYSKTSGSLWQYSNDITAVITTVDFDGDNVTDSFRFKEKIICQIIIIDQLKIMQNYCNI